MELKAVYDSEDEVPEQVRDLGLYEERGGKFCLVKIAGLATAADVERLQRSLKAERDAHGKTKGVLEGITNGMSADEIRAKLDMFPELEAKAAASGDKLDDAKIHDLVSARVNSVKAPLERELNSVKQQLQEKDNLLGTYERQNKIRMIRDEVRSVIRGGKEGKGPKAVDTAEEDILLYAERQLDVVEGRVQTTEQSGFAPGLDPQAWFAELAPRKPHWFGATAGGGGRGSGPGSQFPDNPWSAAGWNLTKQGQAIRENPDRAAQMAKAAGSFVGAATPPAKR